MKRPGKLSHHEDRRLNRKLHQAVSPRVNPPAAGSASSAPARPLRPAPAPAPAAVAAPPSAASTGGQALAAAAHSIYAGELTSEEIALIAARFADIILDDEIWMQRAVNRRLLNLFTQLAAEMKGVGDDDGRSIGLLIKASHALTSGTGRVASLMRDKRALVGEAADGLAGAVAAVLEEISTQMGIKL